MNQIVHQQFKPFPGISAQVYSRTDFEEVREIIYQAAGIVMPPEKATLIYSRLAPLVRASGTQTFGRYIDIIRRDAGELRKVVNALTTNHTFFYRERHHFDHLAAEVRPLLKRKLESGQPVRIWSAGCSTGEELYSIAMTLLGPDRADARPFLTQDMAILATDLADHAVAAAKAATYPLEAFKDVPAELMRPWGKPARGMVEMGPDIRRMIRVRRLNLLQDWPMKKPFDVIFCRNVMIYFDGPTKERLVSRFADQLLPDGHLYIGHSERVSGPASDRLALIGNTIYRKDS